MILLSTDFRGLVIRPRARVAMVREEFGRLEVLADDGTLSHRPGPLDGVAGPPFVAVAPGTLVHPRHARVDGEHLVLPGGWRVAGRLPEALPPEQPVEDPVLPGGVRASEVLYVDSGMGRAFWVTDRGPVAVAGGTRGGSAISRLHPDLRRAGKSWRVNPLRLRALVRDVGDGTHCRLEFDQGTVLDLTSTAALSAARNLGAAHYDRVGGETDLDFDLRVVGLRRWPFPLLGAPAEFLAREYADEPGRLLADLAVQTVEARARGERVPDGHRNWYYTVARVALQKAGHMASVHRAVEELPESALEVGWTGLRGQRRRPAEHRRFSARVPLDFESAWVLACMVWAYLVGTLKLFTYRDAGFRDRKPEARRIGTAHPEVVLLVEKQSLAEIAFRLHERHGVTVMVLGGLPTLIGSEQLAEELRARGVEAVWILSFSDFDPTGWDIPVMQAHHLARYALPTRGIRRLVTPDRFSQDELRRLSVPLETSDSPEYRSRLRRFMKESGGLGGRRRGIQADFLPEERVGRAFEELLRGLIRSPAPAGRRPPVPRG